MKKILVGALAVMMVLGMAACSAKCAYCNDKIDGKGYEYEGKKYCNELCAGLAELEEALS
ncbi:MAG: hypothetical protein E7466_06800 [Ruminococcaceae bacterium]|nr:hypothetical protein [Oscillospiraceae bacterium]MBQ3214595.1 hypothetical protein [Oscillospiraceae bacterium]